jgi:hypothetical protein
MRCLQLFYGSHDLYTLYRGGDNPDFWNPIIKQILKNQIEPFFEMCLNRFLKDVIDCKHYWENDYLDIWEKICSKYRNTGYLFRALIHWDNITVRKEELWTMLIEYSKINLRDTKRNNLLISKFRSLNKSEAEDALNITSYKKLENWLE